MSKQSRSDLSNEELHQMSQRQPGSGAAYLEARRKELPSKRPSSGPRSGTPNASPASRRISWRRAEGQPTQTRRGVRRPRARPPKPRRAKRTPPAPSPGDGCSTRCKRKPGARRHEDAA